MFSKILENFEKEQEELLIKDKVRDQQKFIKINEDLINPIYCPLKFSEKHKIGEKVDMFEKSNNNKSMYYIRDKFYEPTSLDKFIFKKFERKFKFSDFLSDLETDNEIVKELKEFEFTVNNEKLIAFLDKYYCLKFQDEMENENLTNVLKVMFDFDDFTLRKKYKDSANFLNNFEFLCERLEKAILLISLSDEDKINKVDEETKRIESNTKEENKILKRTTRFNQKNKKDFYEIISKVFEDYFERIFYKIDEVLDIIETHEAQARDTLQEKNKELFNIIILILIQYHNIIKNFENNNFSDTKQLSKINAYFGRSTDESFLLINDGTIPFIIHDEYLNKRPVGEYPIEINEIIEKLGEFIKANGFLSEYYDEVLNIRKAVNKETNEQDKWRVYYENVLRLYSLEGPLYKYVNEFFSSYNYKNKYYDNTHLFINSLMKAISYLEKENTNEVLFKVIHMRKKDFDDFKFSKGTLFFNREFMSTTCDVKESIKYVETERNLLKANGNTYELPNDEDSEDNQQLQNNDKIYKLIIEIDTKKFKNILSPSVCDIKQLSAFPYESEFLFAPYSVFEVKNTIMHKENLHSIKVTLVPNYFLDLKKLGNYCPKLPSEPILNGSKSTMLYFNIKDFLNSEDGSQIKNEGPAALPRDRDLNSIFESFSEIQKNTRTANIEELIFESQNSIEFLEEHNEHRFINEFIQILEKTPNVKSINLSSNSLTGADLNVLAEEGLSKTELIRSLNFKKNSIKEITGFVTSLIKHGRTKITELNFSYNRLSINSIRDISRLIKTVNLLKIDLSFNKLNSEAARLLAEKFNETPNLEYLNLSNNNLYSIDYEFELMLNKNFKLVKKLNTILLQGCNLTSQSLKILCENIKYCTELENINFSANSIDEHDYDGSVSLSSNFEKLYKLKSLNLGYNYIGSKGIGGLKNLFTGLKYLQNLEQFSLNGNIISSCWDVLFANFKHTRNLVEIDFNELLIGDEGVKFLSKSFVFLSNIEKLNLNNNNISAKGMEQINFGPLKKLKDLNLSNNKIKASGCSFLKSIRFEVLEMLNLWANDITFEGVKNLISSITKDKQKDIFDADTVALTEINLSQNNIDDKDKLGKSDGLEQILKNILILPRIKVINFSANYLNESSYKKLIAFYPTIRGRRINLNIRDCQAHSDLNNTVKGEFEKMCKEEKSLVLYSY